MLANEYVLCSTVVVVVVVVAVDTQKHLTYNAAYIIIDSAKIDKM